MRRTSQVVAIVIAAAALGTVGHSESESMESARFMFPATIILRGGGLKAPIAFNHSGAFNGNVSNDTIAILYGSLSTFAPKSAEKVRGRPFIEVAEFFGPAYISYASGIRPAPDFAAANHKSRIYLARGGEPALWENPVVAPGGAQYAFYEIGVRGMNALEHRGLKLR